MTSARTIKAQQTKKVGVADWTIKRRLSPFEQTCKMIQQWAKWPIIMSKDLVLNNCFIVNMVCKSKLTQCYVKPRDENMVCNKYLGC